MKMENTENTLDKIVSLCKRRGLIYQGSEIYGGLSGAWDYGPLGVMLKNNLKNIWWKRFVDSRDDIFGIDAALLMRQEVWRASGHVAGFSDPLVSCTKCKRRYRADQLEDREKCPECGGMLGDEKKFNMMFKTYVGAAEDESSVSYLRPETAQGIFVNFKNIVDSFHPRLPFGVAQIGKAFRNEISPRDFLFRTREFEQMEIEYFVEPKDWQSKFDQFREDMHAYVQDIGIDDHKVFEKEIADGERAHYSKRTIDFEFEFPFGQKELFGLAYRTDYDLSNHASVSTVDLKIESDEGQMIIPHVIEPSFGLDRAILAVLSSAYSEDELGGEKRAILKFKPAVAPIKAGVFPLLRNKPELVKKAQELYLILKKELGSAVIFDDNGNIGKRYRRQDEIGTPICVTVDFDTVEKDSTVTARDRDTGEQVRVKDSELMSYISSKIKE